MTHGAVIAGSSRASRSSAARAGRRVIAAHALCSATAALVLLAVMDSVVGAPRMVVFQATTLVVVVNATLLTLTSPKRLWSASSAYLATFCLFHFGLTSVVGFGIVSDDQLSIGTSVWLTGPFAAEAVILGLVGVLAYAAGSQLAALLNGNENRAGDAASSPGSVDEARFASLASLAGAALLLVATGAWIGSVLSTGGTALLLGSYGEYLSSTSASSGLFGWIWLGVGLGTAMVLTAAPSMHRRVGVAAVCALVVIALPLGLRGDVMFPLVGAGVVRAWQNRSISAKLTLLIAVLTLFGISVLRGVRSVGLRAAEYTEINGSVGDGIAELGASLRPVERVVAWRYAGDAFMNGATYWAPFERPVVGLLAPASRVPASEDERLMNVLVMNRVGAIGFSPVAEAFRNFGRPGVAVVLALIGILLRRLDTRAPTRFNQLVGCAVFIPLLINVRNSFVPVPSQILFGVGLAVALRLASKRRRRARRSYVPGAGTSAGTGPQSAALPFPMPPAAAASGGRGSSSGDR